MFGAKGCLFNGRTAIYMLIVGVFLMSIGIQTAARADRAWMPANFPITFWCGPPEPYITVEQYRFIAAAGFNIVMPPCEGESTMARNHKILDTAKATGLKAIIADPRMPLSITGDPKALAAIKAIVADYHKHSALMGYFLTDEPGADSFTGLGEVVAELRRLDPSHLAYINLFPNYASTDLTANPSQLRTDTYDRYLSKYLETVKPDVLSWDHYHFLNGSDRVGFFANLLSGQRAASSTDPPTPFWQIVLSVQHGPYRALNENELRFEAMQTLVHGGSGLAYFTYWQPNDPTFTWSNSIINRNGTPGTNYEPVKRVNQEVRALTKWLYRASIVETFQTGEPTPDGRLAQKSLPFKVTGAGNLSVGFFRGANAFAYVMLANRDYKSAVRTQLTVTIGSHELEVMDMTKNQWKPIAPPKKGEKVMIVDIPLSPAGAALVRWQ